MASGSFPNLSDISSALAFRDAIRRSNRQAFLKPPVALPTASTQFAQVALGSFASQVSDEQQERLRLRHATNAALKKRKRSGKDTAADKDVALANVAGPVGPILKVRRVYVDGFEVPQIWQQSNRILSASLSQAKHELEQLEKEDVDGVSSDSEAESNANDSDGEPVVDGQSVEEELEEDEDEEVEGDVDEDEDDMEDGFDEEGEEEEEDFNQKPLVEDKDGLNDGFFDIDDFNKKSQYFEDQDARANPKTDQVSDDEEVDWHGDPFAVPDKKRKSGKGSDKTRQKDGRGQLDSEEEEDEEDEEDEEGPIFGDMDLDAPSGESDAELDGEDGGLESGMNMELGGEEIYYKDFFAPPPKKRQEGEPWQRPAPYKPDLQDVRRAMADVKRDLFEQISEASGSDEEDVLSDVSDGNPRARRSTHERRQAKILAEIRRLEAEAVRQKDWTLSGEASAGARPMNSLLEEDLEFEHIGKPVPVITQEVTEDIEELTKRRILSQEFDEVRRRYATGLDGGDTARRGLVEIDDQQGTKSLAALYEEEHQQSVNPETYVSQSDEQLAAEEHEVDRMWKELSAKLDALSSWHYKPRPAAPALTVVADVGTVAMEDAQPATAQGVSGGESMLAPQEVYKPGAAGALGRNGGQGGSDDKDVVTVAKTGLPLARDEMSREDKARRRRRNKERIRKSGSGAGGAAVVAATEAANEGTAHAVTKTKSQKRQDTMATLKKAGVRVIGRRGEIEDLDGNKPKAARTVSSGNFKL
ncbi:u3 small nucleolar ribonucleoprotein protein mpp10 [Grosmannia clavigera kw1407]|uniref:U3 small nucleolar ribonucleoprotein protein MPP10 n=1 Tax=Grosmannia clavigera (strain kw1407 / UAMH 11150) TaxID=655863 RepID=F0XI10_GROCL|nr:u3 small nucleolar ribonucleoprotein mpp10 [Grosmannia clavigera kw1407]EFX02837.1 u3 small nucleolar ribonucleoprotein protein mpp10 [Grosmannia clavigera kw1407]